jgi:hypothetical protein
MLGPEPAPRLLVSRVLKAPHLPADERLRDLRRPLKEVTAERLGGTRGFITEPRSLGRLLDVAGFRDRPWHRQHRIHLDPRGQAARAQPRTSQPILRATGSSRAIPV